MFRLGDPAEADLIWFPFQRGRVSTEGARRRQVPAAIWSYAGRLQWVGCSSWKSGGLLAASGLDL